MARVGAPGFAKILQDESAQAHGAVGIIDHLAQLAPLKVEPAGNRGEINRQAVPWDSLQDSLATAPERRTIGNLAGGM